MIKIKIIKEVMACDVLSVAIIYLLCRAVAEAQQRWLHGSVSNHFEDGQQPTIGPMAQGDIQVPYNSF